MKKPVPDCLGRARTWLATESRSLRRSGGSGCRSSRGRSGGFFFSHTAWDNAGRDGLVDAVRHALDTNRHQVGFFTLTPVWGDPPYYQLLLEAGDVPNSDLAERLAQATDAKLQELNCEYEEKRSTGRLGPMRVVRLRPGAWRRFAEQRQARLGGSVEQYKHPCLIPDLEAVAQLFDGQTLD